MVCIRNPQPPNGRGGEEDIAERNDVKSIKDFLRCIGDVKRLVEEERGDIGFGEVLGVIVLVEGSSSSSSSGFKSADRKRVDDDELDTGPAEEEPFSIPWWEDQLDEIGLMDFDVVKWDSGVEEDDKRDKYGGASLSPFVHLHLHGPRPYANYNRIPRNATNPTNPRNARLVRRHRHRQRCQR